MQQPNRPDLLRREPSARALRAPILSVTQTTCSEGMQYRVHVLQRYKGRKAERISHVCAYVSLIVLGNPQRHETGNWEDMGSWGADELQPTSIQPKPQTRATKSCVVTVGAMSDMGRKNFHYVIFVAMLKAFQAWFTAFWEAILVTCSHESTLHSSSSDHCGTEHQSCFLSRFYFVTCFKLYLFFL